MKQELYLHIPEPCHENWGNMTPTEQGRHCSSCDKQVVDFSLMTDQEVLKYFAKASGKACGRFHEDQLQRAMQETRVEKKKGWQFFLAAITSFVMMSKANAQQQKNPVKRGDVAMVSNPLKIGKAVPTCTVNENSDSNRKITGDTITFNLPQLKANSLKADTAKPVLLMGAPALFKPEKKINKITTQGQTVVKVKVPPSEPLVMGKTMQRINVDLNGNTQLPQTVIAGKVTDEAGKPLAFASVTVKDRHYGTSADSEGHFSLALHDEDIGHAVITASYINCESKDMAVITGKESQTNIVLERGQINLVGVTVNSYLTQNMTCMAGGIEVVRANKITVLDTMHTIVRKVSGNETFTIYPNPVARGGSVNISVKTPGEYSIQLLDMSSRILQVQAAASYSKQQSIQIALPSGIAPGYYYIRLVNEKTRKQYVDKVLAH